jgi:hypothetical protein
MYGAGNVDQLGLTFFSNPPPSEGLTLLLDNSENSYLSNVKDFYCGVNFIIQSKTD